MVSGHLVLQEGVAISPVGPNTIVDLNCPTKTGPCSSCFWAFLQCPNCAFA
ncbi:hypothetical protein I79_007311 [Cricetulus griseus]|uniref:Uncharacterized protein n=1 Tax=Cricetulus griseus TaxID=10029 RepID=G3HA68_CRIGR|nr:hypothetical protein I79_007311 [Cricetulus griseus]